MKENKADLLAEVADYYSVKLAEHGETPQGVDWNGTESQILRFEQLCKLINTSASFSINDLGCGYGAFFDFLVGNFESFDYSGLDVSKDMISTAVQRFKDAKNAEFVVSAEPGRIADYCVASGIFNVRLSRPDNEWQAYIEATLDILDRTSSSGFAFNCLSSYSDSEKMRDYLYYADPCKLFDYCKRRYSRNVSILHDYELYEFTILVRK